ncbi:MAG: FMN-binding protein [Huintestinicola sp.]
MGPDTDSIDNITGASFSSKGMKAAVKTAAEAYSKMKGDDPVE